MAIKLGLDGKRYKNFGNRTNDADYEED